MVSDPLSVISTAYLSVMSSPHAVEFVARERSPRSVSAKFIDGSGLAGPRGGCVRTRIASPCGCVDVDVLSNSKGNVMGAIAKRTAVFSAAIAGFALIGAGCSHATKSGETTTSATTSVTSSATPGAVAPTSPSVAPSTTQMTGATATAYPVQGPILDKYNSLDEKARKDLGAPTHDQVTNTDGGIWQPFDGGVIIYKTAAYVVWGK